MRPLALLSAAAAAFLLAGCVTARPAPICPASRNWQAWISVLPGPGARRALIVTGELLLAPQQTAALVPGATDRSQPPSQRFALATGPGDGPVGWKPVRGELSPALPAYREVVIGCEERELARISPVGLAQ
jgi:hypothetical protein